MDIAQLESFLAVVEAGSFTVAAERLHRSQPGVSRQIQRLELEFGALLLRRAASGVSPTPAGQKFLVFARQTLHGLRELQREIEPAPSTPVEPPPDAAVPGLGARIAPNQVRPEATPELGSTPVERQSGSAGPQEADC
jgi:hypothetical protein